MRALLDTCAFLWLDTASAQLGPGAREVLDEPDIELFLSIASVWEIGIKRSLGKLPLVRPVEEAIARYRADNLIHLLPIRAEHVTVIETLAFIHRDPFDRMLAAQALVDGMVVLSPDAKFSAYGVQRIW